MRAHRKRYHPHQRQVLLNCIVKRRVTYYPVEFVLFANELLALLASHLSFLVDVIYILMCRVYTNQMSGQICFVKPS